MRRHTSHSDTHAYSLLVCYFQLPPPPMPPPPPMKRDEEKRAEEKRDKEKKDREKRGEEEREEKERDKEVVISRRTKPASVKEGEESSEERCCCPVPVPMIPGVGAVPPPFAPAAIAAHAFNAGMDAGRRGLHPSVR